MMKPVLLSIWIAIVAVGLSSCSTETEFGDLHAICVDPEKIGDLRELVLNEVQTSGVFPKDAEVIDLSEPLSEPRDDPYPDNPIDVRISMGSNSDILFTNIAGESERVLVGGERPLVEHLLDSFGRQGLLLDRGFFPGEEGGVPLDFCKHATEGPIH